MQQCLHDRASILRHTYIACLANSTLISTPWLMWPIIAPKATGSATLDNKYSVTISLLLQKTVVGQINIFGVHIKKAG